MRRRTQRADLPGWNFGVLEPLAFVDEKSWPNELERDTGCAECTIELESDVFGSYGSLGTCFVSLGLKTMSCGVMLELNQEITSFSKSSHAWCHLSFSLLMLISIPSIWSRGRQHFVALISCSVLRLLTGHSWQAAVVGAAPARLALLPLLNLVGRDASSSSLGSSPTIVSIFRLFDFLDAIAVVDFTAGWTWWQLSHASSDSTKRPYVSKVSCWSSVSLDQALRRSLFRPTKCWEKLRVFSELPSEFFSIRTPVAFDSDIQSSFEGCIEKYSAIAVKLAKSKGLYHCWNVGGILTVSWVESAASRAPSRSIVCSTPNSRKWCEWFSIKR